MTASISLRRAVRQHTSRAALLSATERWRQRVVAQVSGVQSAWSVQKRPAGRAATEASALMDWVEMAPAAARQALQVQRVRIVCLVSTVPPAAQCAPVSMVCVTRV